jgi:nitrogen fixation protein FixH
MSAGTRWILAIVGLLVGNMVAMGVLMGAARSGHSQVIPNYYEKGAHYDDQIAQAAKNRELGWSVTPRWNGSAVVADVTDRDGKALAGAKVDVVSLSRKAGQTRGLHDVTVTVTRGTDVFVQQAVVDAK